MTLTKQQTQTANDKLEAFRTAGNKVAQRTAKGKRAKLCASNFEGLGVDEVWVTFTSEPHVNFDLVGGE